LWVTVPQHVRRTSRGFEVQERLPALQAAEVPREPPPRHCCAEAAQRSRLDGCCRASWGDGPWPVFVRFQGQRASWKMIPSAVRVPAVTVETPCRSPTR
jgi:hypothetical protein